MKFVITLASFISIILASHLLPERSENKTGRIFRGHDAQPGQFPYAVWMEVTFVDDVVYCGGALIGKNWILTAAHCVDGLVFMYVYLGITYLEEAKAAYLLGTDAVYVHEYYNRQTGKADIALIRIPDSTDNCNGISVVRLPKMASNYPDYAHSQVIASGWGATGNSVHPSQRLQWAKLQILLNEVCVPFFNDLTPEDFCTIGPRMASPCPGDSGGPIYLESTGELIGVIKSIRPSGCEEGIPAVHTRVTPYLEWIKAQSGISY